MVGAGSAGCALAARLSENADRSVLLLEAGPAFDRLADFPAELADAYSLAGTAPDNAYNWSFVGELIPQRRYPVPRGRVIGGSSALNASYFVRGRPTDFDAWAAAGNTEWSFEKVLPFFIRLESDSDFDDEWHGGAGPVPVRRTPCDQLHPASQAFYDACRELGFADEPDKNAPGRAGVGRIPLNIRDGVRVNAAMAYLLPNLHRPNLRVCGDSTVRRVLFAGRRAIGVEVERGGLRQLVHANEVVLCAGAVKSAQLLMLSGIGPHEQLRAQQIEVVADAPGVGHDFTDHPSLAVYYRSPAMAVRSADGSFLQIALNTASSGSAAGAEILCYTAPFEQLVTGSAPRDAALALGVSVQQEDSRGELRLVSSDPDIQPTLSYHYLGADSDLRRLRAVVRLAAELLSTSAYRRAGATRASPPDEALADNTLLDAWMAQNLSTSVHLSGTCRMGPDEDPLAVVDQYCRVRGVRGLRVVDTSIMPRVTSRGPSATAIMLGERASAFFG